MTATDSEADYWPQILFIPRLLFCQKFALKTNFSLINAQGSFLFFYSDPWHSSQRTGISATEHTGDIKQYICCMSLIHNPSGHLPLKVPNVKFDFEVPVRQCLLSTHASKSNLTLGTHLHAMMLSSF